MSSDIICRKMSDLASCVRAPIQCVPTVNFTVRNGEAPLTAEDFAFWNQPEVNFFTSPRRDADRGRYAKSRQLSDQTLTLEGLRIIYELLENQNELLPITNSR